MITFTFDEEMMKICLKANGWSTGWDPKRYVHGKTMNADYVDYSLQEAFEMLLQSNNLYGIQFKHGWKL